MKTTHPTQGLTIKPVTVVSVLGQTADVRDRNGSHHTLRTDVLRAKGPAPKPGEVWWIDRYLGGWSFAAIVDYVEKPWAERAAAIEAVDLSAITDPAAKAALQAIKTALTS